MISNVLGRSRLRRWLVLGFLTVALAFGHMIYDAYVGYRLFEWRGGVTHEAKGRTRFGDIDYAWTCPISLPGCAIFELGVRLHGPRPAPQPYGLIGGLMLFAGSLAAGWSLVSIGAAMLRRDGPVWGRLFWRLWLVLACWGWVLVPVELSSVYQWTVVY